MLHVRKTKPYIDGCRHAYTHIHTYIDTYIHTDRQTDRQTERQTDRVRETDMNTYTYSHIEADIINTLVAKPISFYE